MEDSISIQSKQHQNLRPQQRAGQQQIITKNRIPPILVRLNADNQDKSHICCFWAIITIVFCICFIVSFFLPDSLIQISNSNSQKGLNIQGCNNPIGFNFNQLYCNNFSSSQPSIGLVIRPTSSLNQFAIIKLELAPKTSGSDSSVNILINQNATYFTYTLEQGKLIGSNSNILLKKQLQDNQTNSFEFQGQSACTSTSCSDTLTKWIGVLRDIEDDPLFFKIAFTSFVQFTNVQLSSLKLTAQVVYCCLRRYIFLLFSIIALVLYVKKFLKIKKEDVIIQQKMILFASIGLILFNDPFYAITILKPNIFSNILSTFFVVTFISSIMLLWLIFIDRILYEDGKKQTEVYTWKKWIYVNLLHGQLMGFYLAYQFQNTLSLPMVDFSIVNNPKFLALYVIAVVLYFLGLVYVIVQTMRICDLLEKIMYRSFIYMIFSLIFMLLMFIIIVTNGISIYNLDASGILFLFVLMNIYVFYLQYMYTTKQSSQIQSSEFQVQLGESSMLQIDEQQTIVDLNIDITSNNSGFSDNLFPQRKTRKVEQQLNQIHQIKKVQNQKKNESQYHNQKFEKEKSSSQYENFNTFSLQD